MNLKPLALCLALTANPAFAGDYDRLKDPYTLMGLFKTAEKIKYIANGPGIDYVAEQNAEGNRIWTGRFDCSDARARTPYSKAFWQAVNNRLELMERVDETKNLQAELKAACGFDVVMGYW